MVRQNVKLRDMSVPVSASDERSIEVLASGLPICGGSDLAQRSDLSWHRMLQGHNRGWRSADQGAQRQRDEIRRVGPGMQVPFDCGRPRDGRTLEFRSSTADCRESGLRTFP